MLNYTQIGSWLERLAIDATLLLYSEVEYNKMNKQKTSVLFLDIEGTFDHVIKNRLLSILEHLSLSLTLTQ